MEQRKPTPKYTAEFRERGVRLYREQRPDYMSDNAAYRAIASKLGCSHDTIRAWCIQAARDSGERSGLNSDEKACFLSPRGVDDGACEVPEETDAGAIPAVHGRAA